ncbi:NAD(P)H-dependent oxidoreductase [Streptomyces sp. 5-8]|uniref:NAD(P)H-dependent oxidoreductase n=2 Tax=Streptomyces musisoli TaxID=2802280 RepID=A0ABS1PE64_9ACTN|nr:NAD(P)H-dependent oxidoreductase [Streptomyces musisoli]
MPASWSQSTDVMPQQARADMPILIGSTGGTERHSLVLEHALRPMFSYLHAIVSPRPAYAATSDFVTRTGARENASPLPPPTSAACCAHADIVHIARWSTRTSPPCNGCWERHDRRVYAATSSLRFARAAGCCRATDAHRAAPVLCIDVWVVGSTWPGAAIRGGLGQCLCAWSRSLSSLSRSVMSEP